MTDLSVKRTLVKSPPELWSELSEVESLARHLGELGEIRISRLEPEHTVAWEGEQVRGTVEIEASGWGTKVTLTAEVGEAPAPEPAVRDSVAAQGGVADAAVEPVAAEVAVEPEPFEAEATPASDEPQPEASVTPARPEPAPVREAVPPSDRRTRQRRGLLGRWLSRRRGPESRSATSDPPPALEPVLASAIADGRVEVIERGSARAERDLTRSAEPRCEPEPVEVAPEGAQLGQETERAAPEPDAPDAEAVDSHPVDEGGMGPLAAAPSTRVERTQAVLESTLDSLGQAHHRPFSRE